MYPIRMLPLREQMRDTYRLLFFPALLAVFALAAWGLSRYVASGLLLGMLIGGGVGMLPSLVLGTPARMPIGGGDRVAIETWLGNHRHVERARGWVPRMPRALYFDSQIVRLDDHSVVGPVVMLRKLRTLLRANARSGA